VPSTSAWRSIEHGCGVGCQRQGDVETSQAQDIENGSAGAGDRELEAVHDRLVVLGERKAQTGRIDERESADVEDDADTLALEALAGPSTDPAR
jgi:hypothetical protein